MAMNLRALNIGLGKGKAEAKGAPKEKPAKKSAAASVTTLEGGAPRLRSGLLGGKSFKQQMQLLVAAAAILTAVIVVFGLLAIRTATNGTAYVGAAGQMRMLSQRLAKESQQGLQGNTEAFGRLKRSRDEFAGLVESLTNGGAVGGAEVPATSDSVRPSLEKVTQLWQKTDKNIGLVLAQQKSLVTLGNAVKAINTNNPVLLDLAEQVAALKLQTQAGSREISLSGQLVMLTQRMAKNANALLASDVIDPEVTFLLGKDSNTFRDIVTGLAKGSDTLRVSASRDPETVDKLKELETAYGEYRQAVNAILGSLQPLVNAKAAGRNVVGDSEGLLTASDELGVGYESELTSTRWNYVAMAVAAALLVGALFLMWKAYRDETQRRTAEQVRLREEAERLRSEAEAQNKANQEAILRLMNEMGSLADGDLTVQATVTEDITGAIADSVNYTIEELRVLVGRINSAAAQVTIATESAQATSVKLLQAAERQSKEIQEAGASVLKMARAINEVSASASKSVSVARQSLTAATKGQEAVSNSITGMGEIREQIQETSKRIKRLGESSQEIGEIVELISDITEQTNVLALNAAIQAASAGEAGRGFTVVAEEVQRLAERSAEATKQIGAIVKTIQTDTHDAVAAMEKSTVGVVEGAKLSDAAGQALSEIGEVSRRLAQLIEEISVTAQAQAQAAGHVATTMQDILSVTKQTTEGTKQTAVSVGQIAKLAQELKGSVANFKIA
ncbi:MAG TPA: methyl-accepting chemotaxis protein [Burkholderiales bacterium]|nr:methyl-accepting chemotaxis protein [Burkholderiales bacterium]